METQLVSEQSTNNVNKKSSKGFWMFMWFVFVLIICLGTCALLWIVMLYSSESTNLNTNISSNLETKTISGNVSSKSKILEIPINGPILNVKSSSDFFSFAYTVSYGYEIKDILVKAAEDTEIKGILLEIDSPGGTITGSKAIADGVEYYRNKTGNPIYAHIMGMGASGAYWSAASTDYIISDSGSLVGSIGVILGPFKYYKNVVAEQIGGDGITTRDGIDTYYITSGGYKDVGSPDRQMSEDEKKAFQKGNDLAYQVFVDFVANRRKITVDKIKNEIKALPYGEEQALEYKLIDKIGSRETAYVDLATKAGLTSDNYQIVRVKTTANFWSLLLGAELFKSFSPSQVSMVNPMDQLNGKRLYLYNEQQYLK